ncbi:hypothetical protein IIA16_02235, partial [bacterium]|nr:hypothetical protein [bacterium]
MIALLHDGRAGHRSQAEGLRAWLGQGSVHEVSWPGRPQERFARAALWLWQRPVGRVEPPVAAATGVISVGTRAAAGALAEA